MLDQDFCETLEYKICEALESIRDEKVKGFWCDGILLSEPDNYYSQKFINDNRQTKLKAYVGKDGQGVYSLTLKFGNKALSRYTRNLDIAECIPQTDFDKWFSIDIIKQEIEIQLY
ncbi:hypothetical protein DC498_25555 [Terrimonas sp.]|uniref:hypothetical protein n=1 Tax=Terrimonas sp. TaxID=1914338 RepID=UPI000D5194BA|nr:hypothetical protein [Terrimonas sp.]PVD49336.1 hypothetical protein DC498_25555 [Terrimonas sp.]